MVFNQQPEWTWMGKEDLKKNFKPVDRRIMRIIKKKAFKTSLFFLIPFAFLMILIGDLSITLVWGIPFSIFWYSGYRHAQYFLLSERYPDKFPPIIHNDDNTALENQRQLSLDMATNPIYKHLGGNIHYHKNDR